MTNTGADRVKGELGLCPTERLQEVSGDSKALTGEEFNKITWLLSNRSSHPVSGL